MFNNEVEATESEDEEQERAYNIGEDRHKVSTAHNDEEKDASDTDCSTSWEASVETVAMGVTMLKGPKLSSLEEPDSGVFDLDLRV